MIRNVVSGALQGAAAGAAGTTALNAVTYLDMTLRARPSSQTPAAAVEKAAEKAGTGVPGSDEQRQNRLSGLGALAGIGTGVAVGTCYGIARALGWRPSLPVAALVAGAVAMAGSDGSMALLGVTDPRSWSAADWASDIAPHLAFGAVTAATCAPFYSGSTRIAASSAE